MNDIIYLQVEKDEEPEGATWCKDKINDTDIAYIKISFIADWLLNNFLPRMSFEEVMRAQRELAKIIDK